ncbi:MAG: hypothetical protein FWB80_03885 [Defluviitaleaceae bacterium]|nr:hypothetical protein [Defluviitaleaceae bacterium]
MAQKLAPEELAWFANGFMPDYCRVCIAIENFSGSRCREFHEGFWDYFSAFLKDREGFDAQGALEHLFSSFHTMLQKHIPDLNSLSDEYVLLSTRPSTGDECARQLELFRKLEEKEARNGRIS